MSCRGIPHHSAPSLATTRHNAPDAPDAPDAPQRARCTAVHAAHVVRSRLMQRTWRTRSMRLMLSRALGVGRVFAHRALAYRRVKKSLCLQLMKRFISSGLKGPWQLPRTLSLIDKPSGLGCILRLVLSVMSEAQPKLKAGADARQAPAVGRRPRR